MGILYAALLWCCLCTAVYANSWELPDAAYPGPVPPEYQAQPAESKAEPQPSADTTLTEAEPAEIEVLPFELEEELQLPIDATLPEAEPAEIETLPAETEADPQPSADTTLPEAEPAEIETLPAETEADPQPSADTTLPEAEPAEFETLPVEPEADPHLPADIGYPGPVAPEYQAQPAEPEAEAPLPTDTTLPEAEPAEFETLPAEPEAEAPLPTDTTLPEAEPAEFEALPVEPEAEAPPPVDTTLPEAEPAEFEALPAEPEAEAPPPADTTLPEAEPAEFEALPAEPEAEAPPPADTTLPEAGPIEPEMPERKDPQLPPGSDSIDIPAVIDRPFDIEEGPYIAVKAFRLINAEDLPEFGIDIAEIQTGILQNAIQEQPGRGFSIGELQEVAAEVTRFYRGKGLILAQAVVPVQNVVDGVVEMQIFVGILGRILAEGNEGFDLDLLSEPFAHLIGKPVTNQAAEAALLTLTEFPGLSVFGVFQPGLRVGEADMGLEVQEEKSYNVAYRFDNHGLPSTGLDRFRTTIDWNNPTGAADRLTGTIQQTYSPKNNTFWALDYSRYLGRGFSGQLSGYANNFDVGGALAASEIEGESTGYGLSLEKSLIRGRRQNLSAKLGADRKTSRTTTSGTDTNRDELFVLSLNSNYDSVDTYHPLRFLYTGLFNIEEGFGGGLNFAEIGIYQGLEDILGSIGSAEDAAEEPSGERPSRQGRDGVFAAGEFTKIGGSFSRLQLLTQNQSLLIKGEFQYAPDILVPLEQYSTGGPENVRAFPEAQFLFDKAYFLSAEYIINAPFIADKPAFANRTWGELLQLSIFYDFAAGKNNDPTDAPQDVTQQGSWINIRGYGLGLRFSIPGLIESRFIWSRQLGDNSSTPAENGKTEQTWFDFTYSF